jgi:ribokinase
MGTKSGTILVAGAINTDLVATMAQAPRAGETITGSGFAVHGGGKAANQAVAAARAGATVHLVGAVGDDDFGRGRLADLAADGIAIERVRVDSVAPSGVALIFVEASGENRIAYVPGATLTVPPEHVAEAFKEVRPAFVLVTNELPKASIVELVAAANAAGVPVILNATPDPELARDLLQMADVLIVNEGEALVLLQESGTGQPPATLVARLRELGIATVILTAGAEGAFVGDEADVRQYAPPAVEVVDTTGAGDAFCGAFVARLAAGDATDEAVEFAVVASAISVTRAGAQSSIPNLAEVRERLPRA